MQLEKCPGHVGAVFWAQEMLSCSVCVLSVSARWQLSKEILLRTACVTLQESTGLSWELTSSQACHKSPATRLRFKQAK